MADQLETCPCPKCGRVLRQSGELFVELDDRALFIPTFQCDECLMTIDFGGETMEVAVTFARRPDGKIVDPADPDDQALSSFDPASAASVDPRSIEGLMSSASAAPSTTPLGVFDGVARAARRKSTIQQAEWCSSNQNLTLLR